ncbi:MAG: transposase [Pseudorhodoplanes sp.]|nr:transposase [Pseudorhodoplanes sp.]
MRQRERAHQGRFDPARLVFIGETWAKTNMTRLRGWAPYGRKLLAKAPQGQWRTLTVLAALRVNRIGAPCVIDGPINGQTFIAYVEQALVIEQVFAKLKTLLRKAAERTVEATWNASVRFCKPSPRKNAPTTSGTQDMLSSNRIRLKSGMIFPRIEIPLQLFI